MTPYLFVVTLAIVTDVPTHVLEELVPFFQVWDGLADSIDLGGALHQLVRATIGVGLVPTVDLSHGCQPEGEKHIKRLSIPRSKCLLPLF